MVNHGRRKCLAADSSAARPANFQLATGRMQPKKCELFQKWCGVQAESIGALDVYINDFTDHVWLALEHHDLVCAGSTHQAIWVGFAGTFTKDLNIATHQAFSGPAGRFINNL